MPEIGRFISPDTIVPEPANPQSYNRYAYVRNNPMNFTDPSGHRECEIICDGESPGWRTYQDSAWLEGWDVEQQAANAATAKAILIGTVETVVGALWEPADWGLALRDGFQWHDSFGMLPFVPAAVGSKVDDFLQVFKYLPISRADEVNQWAGKIVSYTLEEETVMYRVWGGDADLVGSWLTPIKPSSSESARQLLSLPPQNSALNVSEVRVPTGTRVQFGTAAPAFGQPGGGLQMQLLDLIPRSAFGPGALLP